MGAKRKRSARLSVDLEPELRQRIKAVAAARGVPVRAFVDAALRSALAADAALDVSQKGHEPSELKSHSHISEADRKSGFSALDDLEQLRNQIFSRYGKLSPEAWELLAASRDERSSDLTQAGKG